MPVTIIHTLEVIEIHQHHPEGKAGPGASAELARSPGFDHAEVGEAGKRIGQGELLEQAVLGLDFLVQANRS